MQQGTRVPSPILIVDDDPLMLELLGGALNGLGAEQVITCDSAERGIEQVQSHSPAIEVIFCDLDMPQMDGVEFVRGLARRGYRGGIVFVSGVDPRIVKTAERLATAHNLVVLGALSKPVTLDTLTATLTRWTLDASSPPKATPHAIDPGELHEAITGGDLVNFYQAKVDTATCAVVGVESLVRWRHVTRGMISPDRFIPVAEEHGLIDDLTRMVVARALSDAVEWRRCGLSLSIAINVSMHNLSWLDFPEFMAEEAIASGISPEQVIIEVTESRLMIDPRSALDSLMRLRLKGFRLSIDDFGTGYSTLAQLRDLPFTELKIDRGFVRGVAHDDSMRAIFEGCLSMGRQFGMHVVAEGVEDSTDWSFVRGAGCDLVQGFFVCRPMPPGALLPWMNRWESRAVELTSVSPLTEASV